MDVPLMDESEIKQRVESLAGKNAKILDCEKKSSLVTEEVLLLNGVPVRLIGEAGERIKAALKAGQPPPPEILSEVLMRAGIQTAPVQVETVMSVKSNTKTSEVSTLMDSHGQLVDEKMKEFEEDDEYESTNVEVWEKEPVKLREQMDLEKTKMWDFYNSVNPRPFGVPSSPQGANVHGQTTFTNVTEESTRSKVKSTFNKEPNGQNQYENMQEVPSSSRISKPLRPSSLSTSRRVPEEPMYSNSYGQNPIYQNENYGHNSHNYNGEATYENIPVPLPKIRSPGKMPPLSVPADPKLRPPVPPKPLSIRSSSNLRTNKNLTLPVRVVYETFI